MSWSWRNEENDEIWGQHATPKRRQTFRALTCNTHARPRAYAQPSLNTFKVDARHINRKKINYKIWAQLKKKKQVYSRQSCEHSRASTKLSVLNTISNPSTKCAWEKYHAMAESLAHLFQAPTCPAVTCRGLLPVIIKLLSPIWPWDKDIRDMTHKS